MACKLRESIEEIREVLVKSVKVASTEAKKKVLEAKVKQIDKELRTLNKIEKVERMLKREPISIPRVVIEPTSSRPTFDKLPSHTEGQQTMTYAGIGSRETPPEILKEMTEVAKELEDVGYKLQTGYKRKVGNKIQEEGADKAFSDGASNKELFGPDMANDLATEIAKEIHPNFEGMKSAIYNKWVSKVGSKKAQEYADGAGNLQARNTFQVFGANLGTPVDFVLFYAKETNDPLRPKGGTGQAVEMARRKGIPTINMADKNWKEQLEKVVTKSTEADEVTVENNSAVVPEKETTVDMRGYGKALVEFIKETNKIDIKMDLNRAVEVMKKGTGWGTAFKDRIEYPDFDALTKNDGAIKNVMKATGMTKQQVVDKAKELKNSAYMQMTKVHEHIHAGSVEFMEKNPDAPETKYVNALYKKVQKFAENNPDHPVNSIQNKYWDKNVQEFIAVALSNPDMIKFLSETDVGFNKVVEPKNSILAKLVDKLAKMVGMKGNAEGLLTTLINMNEVENRPEDILPWETLEEYKDRKEGSADRREYDSIVTSKVSKTLPKNYYKVMDNLVKEAIGPEITTSDYLAFSKATLENIAVVGGKYAKGKVTISSKPNQEAMEAQAEGMLEEWYLRNSPYAKQYQNMSTEEFVKSLKEDKIFQEIVAKEKEGVAEQLLEEFGKVNGMHTLAHELVHAGSVEFMKDNPEHKYTKRIDELYQTALDNKVEILRLMGEGKNDYWTTSREEFVAEGLSNPDLVIALKNVKVEGENRFFNVFNEMVDTLLQMIGVQKGSDIYSYLLDGYIAMVESQAKPNAMNKVMDEARSILLSNMKEELGQNMSKKVINTILKETKDC